jgi:hypothetical protein
MTRFVRRSALVLVLAVGLATACGPSDDDAGGNDGVASAAQSDGGAAPPATEAEGVDDLASWAACMRDNGIDMPDPDPDGKLNGAPEIEKGSPEAALYDQAEQACGPIDAFSGDSEPPEPMSDAELEQWLDWAACMRDQGVDMQDPDPETNMPPEPVRDPTLAPGLVDGAMEACTDSLPASATAPRQL